MRDGDWIGDGQFRGIIIIRNLLVGAHGHPISYWMERRGSCQLQAVMHWIMVERTNAIGSIAMRKIVCDEPQK